jgi:hypothetical protein
LLLIPKLPLTCHMRWCLFLWSKIWPKMCQIFLIKDLTKNMTFPHTAQNKNKSNFLMAIIITSLIFNVSPTFN